jgi:malonyl-CoA O-methyltransferase
MRERKARLKGAFDKAAATYDGAAHIQRAVAGRLAERIAALPLPRRPRILEIGCGTGFLTDALRSRLGPAEWTVSDLSPAMVQACRTRLGDPADVTFQTLDGERPALPGDQRFDLICSSLAVQWFEDLPAAVRDLVARLAPGGWLAVSTLAEGTLATWRQAHAALGLKASTPDFPSLEALAVLAPPGVQVQLESERLIQPQPDGRTFLKGLKAIGAATPDGGTKVLPSKDLRRVLARFEALGALGEYHVAYELFRRPSERPLGVFVTGTDTGIGKTVVSSCLARAWAADYWKPVQTGLAEDPGDTQTVAALANLLAERLHPPRFAFAAALSPHAAAAMEGKAVRLGDFTLPRSHRPIVVEGAGGALVPLNGEASMADLCTRLGLPAVVVVRDRLGAISHTLMTLEVLRARGAEILGVVMVGEPFADNAEAIAAHGRVRILARLPWAETVGPAEVAAWARGLPALDALVD